MRTIIHSMVIFSLMLMISLAYAEPAEKTTDKKSVDKIVLYEQPNAKSAVVSSMPSTQPIMPIFSQGEWLKVADPKTGNVGWVSKDSLKNLGVPFVRTETQAIKSPGVAGYKMTQYFGSNPTMDDERIDNMLKQWQAQNKMMQNAFGEMMRQNARQLDNLAQQLESMAQQFQDTDFQVPAIVPVLQPVLFVPEQTSLPAEQNESKVKKVQEQDSNQEK